MRTRLEGILSAYGQTVTLAPREGGEERSFPAFLQPILKKREDLPVTATPLGAVNEKRWLYVGPAGQEIRPGDGVRSDSLRLTVQETETVYFQDAPLYNRAILRQEKERAA